MLTKKLGYYHANNSSNRKQNTGINLSRKGKISPVKTSGGWERKLRIMVYSLMIFHAPVLAEHCDNASITKII